MQKHVCLRLCPRLRPRARLRVRPRLRLGLRTMNGAVIAEFGAALVVFLCFLLVPLINISVIPMRYLIAQEVIAETVHRVAMSETRSEATVLAASGWWTPFLQKCGVAVHPQPMKLIVCGKNAADKITLLPGQAVPPNWLPNGAKGPCIYAMEMTVDADIPPVFNSSAGLPGFTAPIHVRLSGRSNWENLGRDPATRKFYINE